MCDCALSGYSSAPCCGVCSGNVAIANEEKNMVHQVQPVEVCRKFNRNAPEMRRRRNYLL